MDQACFGLHPIQAEGLHQSTRGSEYSATPLFFATQFLEMQLEPAPANARRPRQ